jgi:hypothetical protein
MASPSFSSPIIESELIESPACSRLELGHDEFRRVFSLNNDVNVIGSNVRSEYAPAVGNAATCNPF